MFKSISLLSIFIISIYATTQEEDKVATIVKNDFVIHPNGSYVYAYETTNTIKGTENGNGGVSSDGAFSWTANDGSTIVLTFIADEKGYHPKYTVKHPSGSQSAPVAAAASAPEPNVILPSS